jgi:transcription elongation factor GreA
MDEEKKFPMTQEGYNKLSAELDDLIMNKRVEITKRIQEARQFGDLSENSEYSSAKDEQARNESRILQIQNMLQYAEIHDASDVAKNEVSLGKEVTFKETPKGDEETYTIVGSAEADVLDNKISNESPMGAALIGKKTGDKVAIPLPNGSTMNVEILKVK